MPSHEFIDLLGEMKDLHIRKSADYAQDDNAYSNFEFAAIVSQPFKDPADRVFATMIGVKLARLAELLGSDKTPNNESVEDTMKDMSVYSTMWAAHRRKRRMAA